MNRKTRKQRGSHPTKGWGQTSRTKKRKNRQVRKKTMRKNRRRHN